MNGNLIVCHYYQGRVEAYIDGTLSPLVRRRIGQHLDTCPHCYAFYQQRRVMRHQLLAAVPAVGRSHAPDFDRLWGAIRADLPQMQPQYKRAQWYYGVIMALLVAMMTLPMLLQGAKLSANLPLQPRPQSDATATPAHYHASVTLAAATQHGRAVFATPPTLPEPNHRQ